MTDETRSEFVQTYLRRCDRFVSTIERDSSAAFAPGRYFETIIWEWSNETKKRGLMIHITDSGTDADTALENHFAICRKITKNERLEE